MAFEKPFPCYLVNFYSVLNFWLIYHLLVRGFPQSSRKESPPGGSHGALPAPLIQCSLGGRIIVYFVSQLDWIMWVLGLCILFVSLALGSSLFLNKAQINPSWLKGRVMNFQISCSLFKLLSFWVTGVWIPREEIIRWYNVLVDWVPLRKKERDDSVWGCWGQFLGGPGSGLGPHGGVTFKLTEGTEHAGGENSMSRGHRWGQLWKNTTRLDTWASASCYTH